MLKKGQEIEILISGYDYPNKPYGIFGDKKIYPQGNLVIGSRVKGIITKIRNKKIELKKVEIIEKSSKEIEPLCEHFNLCGGCSFQNLNYDDQLELKMKLLQDIILKSIPYEVNIKKPLKSPLEFQYRNKMEFSFGNEIKDGPLTLGMHKKNSFHDVITVDNCQLMDEDFRKILRLTLDYFKNKEISFYHRMQHTGYLRNMVIRKGEKTGEIGVNLITTSQLDFSLEEWKNKLLETEFNNKLVSIIHTINDNLSDSVQCDKEIILYGNRDINEIIFDLNFKISPYSFFQTNSLGVEILYGKVMEYLKDIGIQEGERKVVFDLFSGTGTIGQIVSKEAKQVYGIELIEEAVEKANESAKKNKITNCSFIAGDVFEKLDELVLENILPDIIILDPPRVGIGHKTVMKLCKYNIKKLIYVSCNPKSFVTDIITFYENGYRLMEITPVDMFPQTPHFEIVSVLEKI